MGKLKDKVVKKKHLQKLSDSLVLVIPHNWIQEMEWSRDIFLDVVWRPAEEEIIIKRNLDVIELEEAS